MRTCVREERKIAFIARIMALLRKHTRTCMSKRRLVSGCQLSNNKIHIFTSVLLRIKKEVNYFFFFLILERLTCSRWRWTRPSSAGCLCPCCTPPSGPQLFPLYHMQRSFWPARGRSGWRTSRRPASACCGDSSKSKTQIGGESQLAQSRWNPPFPAKHLWK